MSVTEDIQGYENHLESRVYLVDVFEKYGLEIVIQDIEKTLLEENPEKVNATLLFLRDACLFSRNYPEYDVYADAFRRALPVSSIFPLLGKHLLSTNRTMRQHAVFTFGKIGFPQNLSLLKKALGWYQTHYPDEVEKLRFEISWLENLTSKTPDPLPPKQSVRVQE